MRAQIRRERVEVVRHDRVGRESHRHVGDYREQLLEVRVVQDALRIVLRVVVVGLPLLRDGLELYARNAGSGECPVICPRVRVVVGLCPVRRVLLVRGQDLLDERVQLRHAVHVHRFARHAHELEADVGHAPADPIGVLDVYLVVCPPAPVVVCVVDAVLLGRVRREYYGPRRDYVVLLADLGHRLRDDEHGRDARCVIHAAREPRIVVGPDDHILVRRLAVVRPWEEADHVVRLATRVRRGLHDVAVHVDLDDLPRVQPGYDLRRVLLADRDQGRPAGHIEAIVAREGLDALPDVAVDCRHDYAYRPVLPGAVGDGIDPVIVTDPVHQDDLPPDVLADVVGVVPVVDPDDIRGDGLVDLLRALVVRPREAAERGGRHLPYAWHIEPGLPELPGVDWDCLLGHVREADLAHLGHDVISQCQVCRSTGPPEPERAVAHRTGGLDDVRGVVHIQIAHDARCPVDLLGVGCERRYWHCKDDCQESRDYSP